jgi:aldose 1-epimerase
VDGQLVELAPNFPDGSAIHGQVYRAPWQVQPDGTLSVEGGGSGWPWSYRATLRVSIVGTELRIALALRNLSTSTMPAGIGLHPWFRRPVEISINAASALPSNTDAGAALTAVTARLDLRVPGPMPDDLDATWRPDRDPAATLHWPDRGLTARLTVRSNTDAYIVAASPRTLDAVAVEPQTHAPFGLSRFLDGRPGRLHPLAPGATLRLEIILAFDQLGSP